jgi:hypothetical protein
MTYAYRTAPFPHQHAEFEATRDREHWGLWWEMGVAKTKVVVDTASYLWMTGKIDGVLVMAPSGVHTQWVDDQIPEHAPLQVLDSLDRFVWYTSKAGNKGFQAEWQRFLKRPRAAGLSVMTMTYDSLMTEAGAHAAKAFLTGRRVMLVLDETTVIKTPGAKVTKRVLAMAKYAPYRRVLNGTPGTDSPFEFYSQVKALNPDAWKALGIADSQAFQTYFGVFEKRQLKEPRTITGNGGRKWQMTHFDHLVAYKNLEDMARIVLAHGSRLLKRDVFPNLPPKLYSKVYFELTSKQRKAYNDLRDEYRTWLSGGDLVTAELAIVRLTRLSQICSGYLPVDGDDEPTALVDPKDNPRIKLLEDVIADIPGKFIVWAKYNVDIDLISALLRRLGIVHVTWDGRTSEEDRRTGKHRFVEGDARAFVAKASSSAGRGLNLQVADTVVYYNNSFVADDRLQSEDRAHRPGIHHPVKYIDLIAQDTIDQKIVDALRKKRETAAVVTGDSLADWI